MAFMVTKRNRKSEGSQRHVTDGAGNVLLPPVQWLLPHMAQSVRPDPDTLWSPAKTKVLLKAKGLKYADLAAPLKLTRQAVGHWFRNRGEPDMRQLKIIAKTLGVHWLELVDEEVDVVWNPAEKARLDQIRKLDPESLALIDAQLKLIGRKDVK